LRQKLHERALVIYEDSDILLLEKSAGLLSYPIPNNRSDSAIQLIRRYWKSRNLHNRNLYLLHRLDRDTSGLMIFAKTTLARKSLTVQFNEHSIIRGYIAVTQGIPSPVKGTLETILGRKVSGKRGVTNHGRQSKTYYEVQHSSSKRALVYCSLYTGRTHQVRIHLAHLGAPVVGDPIYGRIKGKRLYLHSHILGFIHPRTHKPQLFLSSIPTEFKRELAEARLSRPTSAKPGLKP
jgi:23S rRNA pseudouridine1911/1915/1917 synthase